MKRAIQYMLFFAALTAVIPACESERGDLTHIPFHPEPIALQEFDGFVKMVIPADNPLTKDGVALGRMLFYDPILSADSSISCASCHIREKGFSDGRVKSLGVAQKAGRRNSMSLWHVGYYYTGLFWDGRTATLEAQALQPVTHPDEMNSEWPLVLKRLRNHPEYPGAFRRAFGIEHREEISREWVARALAQFERTLNGADSKFDRVQRGEAEFSPSELRGWNIFFDASNELPHAECSHCHSDPLFSNLDYENNCLAPGSPRVGKSDPGRGAFTGRRPDFGKFRVPTLRNVALTAPYMHDGRFATLAEVVEHYNSGGHFSEYVSPNVRPLNLSERDQADLIAFLHTLTDTTSLNKPEFENPFIEEY